ncbi:MAG: SUMF1/EgtB/PvdO family nonheme iron enzyme [Chitinispirillaceae bacterium]|nr:SUMF1/EgtB/PvdO family nonheme iron enzyme [Chitinispirillaceae bacterium]
MRRIWFGIGGCLLCAGIVFASEQPELLRCKIIERKGEITAWSKTTSRKDVFKDTSKLNSGTTLLLPSGASLQLTFEPLIELILRQSTTISFDNLLIDRAGGVIRMKCAMEKGSLYLKAPPQAGFVLLFTLQSPAAVIDVAAAELSIQVDDAGTTTVEVVHGSVKILPRESTLKTVLNKGSRGVVHPGKPQVALSAAGDARSMTKQAFQGDQPSIAILSVKSRDASRDDLEHISNSVAREFSQTTRAKVLFLDEVKKLLHAEGGDRLLECFTDSCISRIGSKAGVDVVIVGDLGLLGSTHILDLKMVDVLRDKILSRTSVSVKEDLGKILDEIPKAIGKLVEVDTVLTSVVKKPVATETGISESAGYKEKIVWVFPGTFVMGSQFNSGEVDELPTHKVKLDGFYIDRFEVTREEFEKIMGYNPVPSKGCGACPVTNVTWQEAADYCKKVGKRLPTEAEWEYACRAGTRTPFSTGVTITDGQADFDAQKPFGGSRPGVFRGKVVPVGSFEVNGWNLHDMHGNVAEWCSDWYDVAYYGNASEKNPRGPAKGKLKVVRGGGWNNDGNSLRSANRTAYNPELRLGNIGFRCVKDDTAEK